MNPMQLIQMLKCNQNPTGFVTNMLREKSGNNPMINNALDMMNCGNTQGVEQIVRNMCKEKGIDPNEAMRQAKSMFGMK